MTWAERSAMLLARLQLRAPDLRSILLAGPRSSLDLAQLAEQLQGAARRAGVEARLLRVSPHEPRATSPVGDMLSAEDVATPSKARQKLSRGDCLTIVLGSGILDSPGTLIVASVADAVLLAARKGRTSRKDLSDASLEIERAGGRLAGAVLLD